MGREDTSLGLSRPFTLIAPVGREESNIGPSLQGLRGGGGQEELLVSKSHSVEEGEEERGRRRLDLGTRR